MTQLPELAHVTRNKLHALMDLSWEVCASTSRPESEAHEAAREQQRLTRGGKEAGAGAQKPLQ